MESEELSTLRRALAAERSKNKQLTKQLNLKLNENFAFVCTNQKEQILSGSTGASVQLENRAANLKKMLNQEEGIASSLQIILQQMIQEKLQLETALEQERERSIETMSQQIAQVLSEKLYFPLRDLERRVQSQSASDADSARSSAAEESIDSSFSSDSGSGREREERKRRKLMESELAYWKQQLRLAKKEIRKDKEIYRQLQLNQQKLLAENSELTKNQEGGTDYSLGSSRNQTQYSLNSNK